MCRPTKFLKWTNLWGARREAGATSNRQREKRYLLFVFPLCLFRSGCDLFPGTFFQRVQRIRRQIVKTLHQSARPAYLHRFGLRGGTKAEVYPQVILRNIAGPASHFVDEHSLAILNDNSCANPVTIRAYPDSLESNPMVPGMDGVPQQARRCIHIVNHHGELPIIP